MTMKLAALSLALAIGAAVFLLTFPFYLGLGGSLTLIDANGSWVLIPILLPVVVAAVEATRARHLWGTRWPTNFLVVFGFWRMAAWL